MEQQIVPAPEIATKVATSLMEKPETALVVAGGAVALAGVAVGVWAANSSSER